MTTHETNNVINGPWKAMSKRKVILPLSDETLVSLLNLLEVVYIEK